MPKVVHRLALDLTTQHAYDYYAAADQAEELAHDATLRADHRRIWADVAALLRRRGDNFQR